MYLLVPGSSSWEQISSAMHSTFSAVHPVFGLPLPVLHFVADPCTFLHFHVNLWSSTSSFFSGNLQGHNSRVLIGPADFPRPNPTPLNNASVHTHRERLLPPRKHRCSLWETPVARNRIGQFLIRVL